MLNRTDVEDNPAVRALNRAFRADPAAIHALLCNRVPCNVALADDPAVVVEANPVLDCGWTVSALGLINGVLTELGLPVVASRWGDEVNADGHRALLGFQSCKPTGGAP